MTTSNPITLKPASVLTNERLGSPLFAKIYEEPGSHIMIESQVPSFVRDDHPKFIKFLEAYYEWMETTGNVAYHKRKLKKYQDIDETTDQMFEHFWDEFVINFPKDVLADRKTLLKHIRQFYRAKGTEKSYRLFFRILFNASVEFYYPRADILRTSDGKWIKNVAIKVIPIKGTLADVSNQKIVARETGISAFVDKGMVVRMGQLEAYELNLNTASLTGTLRPNEIIQTASGSFVGKISPVPNAFSWYSDVLTPTKQYRGSGYAKGDLFKIPDSPNGPQNGSGAILRVASLNSEEIEMHETCSQISDGTTSEFSISHTPIYVKNNTAWNVWSERVDDPGTFTLIEESAYEVYDTKIIFYEPLPNRTRIRVQYKYDIQSIKRLEIVKFGMEYYHSEKTSPYVMELNSTNSVGNTKGSGAKIIIHIGGLAEYPGYYAGNDGHLSSGKYIHDGHFYQQFSYVTLTNESSSQYETTLKKLLHPAGLKFFGGFRNQNLVPGTTKLPNTQKNPHIRIELKQFAHPRRAVQTALNATSKIYTQVCARHEITQDNRSCPIGASFRSLYRERFNYKPASRFQDVSTGLWGDPQSIRTQTANTPISTFSNLNITPKDVQETLPQKRINIQPDGVVKKRAE